jgi:NAD(P)-dependent dehydrogenase (short-subunit alcohol dehydrogenase family)
MDRFDGQIVLVTGASSGMGAAAAVEFGRRGAVVICADRQEERGLATLAEVRSAGGEGDFVRTDIADEDSLAALFSFIESKYGRLDGAFNNAGIQIPLASLPDTPVSGLDDLYATNVRGTFMCLQHEMRIMQRQRSGAIANTSSIGGVMGIRSCAAYVASKFAVVGMSRSAALEMAEFGVRVNVICPGTIRTEMMEHFIEGAPDGENSLASLAPIGRIGRAQEIADVAVWLLSASSSYVTGQAINVDGGVSAGVAPISFFQR